MKKILLLLLCSLHIVSCIDSKSKSIVQSPDSVTEVGVLIDADSLFIGLYNNKKELVSPSPVNLFLNGEVLKWSLIAEKSFDKKDFISMPYGEFQSVSQEYKEAIFKLSVQTKSGKTYPAELFVRAYSEGMAYRIVLNDLPEDSRLQERSEWIPVSSKGKCFIPNGEKMPIGPVSISGLKSRHTTPVIYSTDNSTLAFHEAGLHNYPQLFLSKGIDGKSIKMVQDEAVCNGTFSLPWRVILVGEKIADLHNYKSLYFSLNEAAEGDFSWVKPGIASWDWRVKGCTFNGFTYKMNTESLKRYIDFSAEMGFDYFLLDAEWYEDHNPLKPVEGLDIKEVISYGNGKNVGTLLYYDLKYADKEYPVIDFEEIASVYAGYGAKGIKYGFLGGAGPKYTSQEKTRKTEELIRIAAQHKLLIDFHDSPVPFSGLERTYPNYINREYCHAQIDCRLAFSPEEFVKIACVNLLAGPIDQTNGTYALNEMKSRQKGPRNEYNSTVASETARFFITHTGHLSVLIDAPEAYKAKSDLFAFIRSLPATWDEARYLEMDFESHVAVARRKGEDWFAGVVYNEKGGKHMMDLNFLEPSVKYEATIFSDAPDTHYINNKEAYIVKKEVVQSDKVLETTVAPGGGYAVLFRKHKSDHTK